MISKCTLLTVWYTLRYGLMEMSVISGHDFKQTGKVHDDHWELICKRCKAKAGTEQL